MKTNSAEITWLMVIFIWYVYTGISRQAVYVYIGLKESINI